MMNDSDFWPPLGSYRVIERELKAIAAVVCGSCNRPLEAPTWGPGHIRLYCPDCGELLIRVDDNEAGSVDVTIMGSIYSPCILRASPDPVFTFYGVLEEDSGGEPGGYIQVKKYPEDKKDIKITDGKDMKFPKDLEEIIDDE